MALDREDGTHGDEGHTLATPKEAENGGQHEAQIEVDEGDVLGAVLVQHGIIPGDEGEVAWPLQSSLLNKFWLGDEDEEWSIRTHFFIIGRILVEYRRMNDLGRE